MLIFPAQTGIRSLATFMVYIHHYNPFSIEYFGKYTHDFLVNFILELLFSLY